MPATEAEPSFEAAFAELDAVVESLGRGELTLEALVARYQRGIELAQYCNARLDAAELKVRALRETPDGLHLGAFARSND